MSVHSPDERAGAAEVPSSPERAKDEFPSRDPETLCAQMLAAFRQLDDTMLLRNGDKRDTFICTMNRAVTLLRSMKNTLHIPVSDEEFSAAYLDMFSLAHSEEATENDPELSQSQRGAIICQILLRRRLAALSASTPEGK
jgi:hypothetical protein